MCVRVCNSVRAVPCARARVSTVVHTRTSRPFELPVLAVGDNSNDAFPVVLPEPQRIVNDLIFRFSWGLVGDHEARPV